MTDIHWTKSQIVEWRKIALSKIVIYTYGFVSSNAISDDKKDTDRENPNLDATIIRPDAIASKLLLFLLTFVSIVIQTVIPIAISITLPKPDGLCPSKASPLKKFIGFVLCLFFVSLTINMCLGKLRGMGFLKLFCSNDFRMLGYYRFFVDVGIISNIISMTAAGVSQYILFIRNVEKDFVALVLQSLAMQFVLTADEKLITPSWSSWTKRRLEILMRHEAEKARERGQDENVNIETVGADNLPLNEDMIKKTTVMFYAEASFLVMVTLIGITWSIGLAYCM